MKKHQESQASTESRFKVFSRENFTSSIEVVKIKPLQAILPIEIKGPTCLYLEKIAAILSFISVVIFTVAIGFPGDLTASPAAGNSVPEKIAFRHLTTADGLSNNMIHCITQDGEGLLWISTTNGISRFDPNTGIFVNYTKNEGLQKKERAPGARR